jgi:hypothetical protein
MVWMPRAWCHFNLYLTRSKKACRGPVLHSHDIQYPIIVAMKYTIGAGQSQSLLHSSGVTSQPSHVLVLETYFKGGRGFFEIITV